MRNVDWARKCFLKHLRPTANGRNPSLLNGAHARLRLNPARASQNLYGLNPSPTALARDTYKYHAQAQWGWDSSRKGFVMLVQDSGGGARELHSEGSDSGRVQWDGDALGSTSARS